MRKVLSEVQFAVDDKETRKQYIGGSEIGIILGANKYKSNIYLYLEKTGEIENDFFGNELTYWGQTLEPIILKHYSEVENCNIIDRPAETFCHPDYPFLIFHPDGLIPNKNKGLEIKTAGFMMQRNWDENQDGIDIQYIPQVALGMAIFDVPEWDVAVLIGGQKYRKYTVRRDKEFEEIMLVKAARFWDAVQNKIRPEPETLSDVNRLFAMGGLDPIIADNDLESVVTDLTIIKDQIKDAEEKKKELERHIKERMENHDVLINLSGEQLCTWKKSKDTAKLDVKLLQSKNPEIYNQYLVLRPGYRRFLTKI